MSYDMYLMEKAGSPCQVSPHNLRGGTHAMGPSSEAWLNITYNYSEIMKRVLPGGVRGLYSMTGKASVPILETGIALLDEDTETLNYWTATEGNVRKALQGLLHLANAAPKGVWAGD